MGEVIAYPRNKSSTRPRESAGASAKILFFTGVRYSRMSEPAPHFTNNSRPSSTGGKRRRKRG